MKKRRFGVPIAAAVSAIVALAGCSPVGSSTPAGTTGSTPAGTTGSTPAGTTGNRPARTTEGGRPARTTDSRPAGTTVVVTMDDGSRGRMTYTDPATALPARFPKAVPVPRLKLTRAEETHSAKGTSWTAYYEAAGSTARAMQAEARALTAAGFEAIAAEVVAGPYLKGRYVVVLGEHGSQLLLTVALT